MEFTREKVIGTKSEYITFKGLTAKDEKVVIELSQGTPFKRFKWWKDYKHDTYIRLVDYVTDAEGTCRGMQYNPQGYYLITPEYRGYQINRNYLFEDTEANRLKVINDVCNLAFGEDAVEA